MVLHSAGIKRHGSISTAPGIRLEVRTGIFERCRVWPSKPPIPCRQRFWLWGLAFSFQKPASRKDCERTAIEYIEYGAPRFDSYNHLELLTVMCYQCWRTYQKHAGLPERELSVQLRTCRTGSYGQRLPEWNPVSSAYSFRCGSGADWSNTVTTVWLIFQMMGHDVKQLEIQRAESWRWDNRCFLKIRRYSFLLLACMLMIYIWALWHYPF